MMIRKPTMEDAQIFIEAMRASQTYHHPWTHSPQTQQEFENFIHRSQQNTHKSFLVFNDTNQLAGVFNISEIVRGHFQSAYLGFYGVAQYAGQGLMSAGLKLVLKELFEKSFLHRVEANIQPENVRSIHLVKKNGFNKEGLSPRYLKINDQWRDHERWAITYEDWANIEPRHIKKNNIVIRDLHQHDFPTLDKHFGATSVYKKPMDLWERYCHQHETKERIVKIIKFNNHVAGFCTLKLNSDYENFRKNNIPEINDLLIAPDYRNQGLGQALVESLESIATSLGYQTIGLAVGLYNDYGAAQRLYARMGYVPDGNGITYHHQCVVPGDNYCVDDDLLLWLRKSIAQN